jgi:hypothetical protein
MLARGIAVSRVKKLMLVTITVLNCAVAVSVLASGNTAQGAAQRPMSRLDTTPAPGAAVSSHALQNVGGAQWSLTSFTNQLGQVCAGEKIPNDEGDGGQALTCRDPRTLFTNGPLVTFAGSRQSSSDLLHWENAWVWGWAAPSVAKVTLLLTSCAEVNVPIVEGGLYFIVLPSAELRAGVGPQQVVASSAGGEVLARNDVLLERPRTRDGVASGVAPVRGNC